MYLIEGSRRMQSEPKLVWKKKTPTKEGWYRYRDEDREAVVLHVFDPLNNGHFKAWDWDHGRLMLCAIKTYQGLWRGPMEAPK